MKLWMVWVGHRFFRDEDHLWGIIQDDDNTLPKEYSFQKTAFCRYSFAVKCNSIELMKLEATDAYALKLQDMIEQRLLLGYEKLSQAEVEDRWPSLIEEIEMQFVIWKLQNA